MFWPVRVLSVGRLRRRSRAVSQWVTLLPVVRETEAGDRVAEAIMDDRLLAPDFDRFARHYDDEHASYTDDIPMWEGFAYRSGDGPILELACGTGRLLLPLARVGAVITGVDLSPAMLAIARAKVATADLHHQVTLLEGDMREVVTSSQFAMAFIGLNSLMHLETRADQRRAIAAAGRQLVSGGRFIIDVFNPDDGLPDTTQEGQVLLHCLKIRPDRSQLQHFQSLSVDRGSQLISVMNYYDEVSASGEVRRHLAPFRLRYLAVGELELMLEHEGFRIEDLYGSYDLEPYRHGSARIIFVARRR